MSVTLVPWGSNVDELQAARGEELTEEMVSEWSITRSRSSGEVTRFLEMYRSALKAMLEIAPFHWVVTMGVDSEKKIMYIPNQFCAIIKASNSVVVSLIKDRRDRIYSDVYQWAEGMPSFERGKTWAVEDWKWYFLFLIDGEVSRDIKRSRELNAQLTPLSERILNYTQALLDLKYK